MAGSDNTNAHSCAIIPILIRDEDEWQGISDPIARRRIQNRRNQRAFRSRIRKERGKECDTVRAPQDTCTVSPLALMQQGRAEYDIVTIASAIRSIKILDPASRKSQMVVKDFEALARSYYATRVPAITLRPLLSQFNFIRALWANVEVLGLSSSQMSNDDEASPFNASESTRDMASMAQEARLPAGLRPNALQRATLHHPWIDLLPFPKMRDNLFQWGLENVDEEELCHDMRGRADQEPGMLVWLDPWDPNGWEVTESFVKSWGWAIIGCCELFHSTNKWRAKRGQRPLF